MEQSICGGNCWEGGDISCGLWSSMIVSTQTRAFGR
uniref:Uncharacterized protein n=1 Tax=Arundo donax TaxID=35708 RepID=A0A0A9BVU1_ARUDO